MRALVMVLLAACGGGSSSTVDAALDRDADVDASAPADAASLLGTVGNVMDLTACPASAPPNATCKRVTVTGCPDIPSQPLDAILAIVPAVGTTRGTIVHFSGGGGDSFQIGGAQQYRNGGFRQVFVAWVSDWETTVGAGIKAAGCRPSTLLSWIFAEPTLHAGSRTFGFCGEGFSGGSGQLGYALAHYGLGDTLDYVNLLSGPPFARIDLGCDGDAPATGPVCGTMTTMRLPGPRLNAWENIQPPASCGGTVIAATELARWKSDSIAFGGEYEHPRTRVELFVCTNQATAVTAMAQLYYDVLMTSTGGTAFHCYAQADGCMGEGLGTGNQDATQAMLAGCIPRH